jgi:hypothetical protein
MRRAFVLVCCLLFSCAAAPAERFGICDASAAAFVAPDSWWVADDEDNILRRFDSSGMVATAELDLTEFLRPAKAGREVDLEAVARIGETFYWIGSHGSSGSGKPRPSRHRLFATQLTETGDLVPVGKPFRRLIKTLQADPRYASLGLDGTVETEALTSWTGETLLIGFRQPISDGLALLVPLKNPHELLIDGADPTIGDPVRLDLGGRTVRSMARLEEGSWLLTAGEVEGRADWIGSWDGEVGHAVKPLGELEINAEAIMVDRLGRRIWLLSDDGRRAIGGRDCKEIEDPRKRRFRFRSFPWPGK